MLSKFTQIVWACAAVGLTVTLVSYAFGLVPHSSESGNGAAGTTGSPTAVIAAEADGDSRNLDDLCVTGHCRNSACHADCDRIPNNHGVAN